MTTEFVIDGEIMEISIILFITFIYICNILSRIKLIKKGDYTMNELEKCFIKPFFDIIIPCPDDPEDILNKFTHQVNGIGKKQHGPHLVNGFVVSHMMLFGCLSFMFPRKRSLLFSIGVLWEIYECTTLHNNNMDVFFNLFGILAAAI
jgi:hypothetical protein